MPLKAQKRDKAYYLRQLAKRHPEVFARVRKEELTEVEAFDLTGIKPKPDPLVSLRRDWGKASAKARKQFVEEMGPELDGIQRTATNQLIAAWGRCSQEERGRFLYALIGTSAGVALVKKLIARVEASV